MPTYAYRAKVTPTEVTEGTLEAPTRDAALKRIEEMGLFAVSIEERAVSQAARRPRSSGKAGHREMIIFSRQLATLLRSGIPILKALGILSEQEQNPYFASVIADIHAQLKEGSHFSRALEKFPRIFSPFYVSLCAAGEDSGKLDEVLMRLAAHFKSQEEIISKVKLAFIYPAIMACVGAGTVVFMFAFVMPRLTGIFRDIGQKLPLPTKVLIAVSGFVTSKGWILLVCLVCVVSIVRFQLQRRQGKAMWNRLQLRLPLVGSLVLKKELAVLSKTLELLIQSGIPVLKALELTAPVIGNEVIRESFLKGYSELKQGSALGATLRQYKVFPVFMTSLITVGEESGKLDVPLSELAAVYEKETEDGVRAFTAILEPVMILGMGLVVGFIVMAMLLPIFEINLAVH